MWIFEEENDFFSEFIRIINGFSQIGDRIKLAKELSRPVIIIKLSFGRHSQVVRQGSAKPSPPVQIWVPPFFQYCDLF